MTEFSTQEILQVCCIFCVQGLAKITFETSISLPRAHNREVLLYISKTILKRKPTSFKMYLTLPALDFPQKCKTCHVCPSSLNPLSLKDVF